MRLDLRRGALPREVLSGIPSRKVTLATLTTQLQNRPQLQLRFAFALQMPAHNW